MNPLRPEKPPPPGPPELSSRVGPLPRFVLSTQPSLPLRFTCESKAVSRTRHGPPYATAPTGTEPTVLDKGDLSCDRAPWPHSESIMAGTTKCRVCASGCGRHSVARRHGACRPSRCLTTQASASALQRSYTLLQIFRGRGGKRGLANTSL